MQMNRAMFMLRTSIITAFKNGRPVQQAALLVAGGNGLAQAPNQFNHPVDVYLDAAKNIYVADINTESSDYHRVQRWAPGAVSGITVAVAAASLVTCWLFMFRQTARFTNGQWC